MDNVKSKQLVETLKKFFKIATNGGVKKELANAHPGMGAVVMKDGSLIAKRKHIRMGLLLLK